jgi:hypothetical protein
VAGDLVGCIFWLAVSTHFFWSRLLCIKIVVTRDTGVYLDWALCSLLAAP